MTVTTEVRARTELSRRAAWWTAALIAVVALWTSGAPSMVYPVYVAEWGLTTAQTSLIFAIYPLVLVLTLLGLGDLSDHLGRRPVLVAGLLAGLAGTVLFAVAGGLGLLLIGRALMGIGVGLSLSAATAAMLEYATPGTEGRSGSMTTAATATGIAAATLLGGALVEYAPAPLRTSYWLLAAVLLVLVVAATRLPRTPGTAVGRWSPRLPVFPRGLRLATMCAAFAIAAAYSIGGMFLALGAQIGEDLVGTTNALVVGAVISLSAVSIAVTAVAAADLGARASMILGAVVMMASIAILLGSAHASSLWLFLASSLIGGIGYGLLFRGGLTLVNAAAPPSHRAGVLSTAYLVGYLFQGLTALGLGTLVRDLGFTTGLDVGAPLIGLLGVVALVLALAVRPVRAPA